MAQKSSAKPAHTPSTLQLLPDLEFGKKDQNDLIKSEGLKSEIWRWFIHFTLFRQGAKYSLC